MKIALLENLNQAKNNPSVKTIVLCGKGNFLAGGDIKEFSNQEVPGIKSCMQGSYVVFSWVFQFKKFPVRKVEFSQFISLSNSQTANV